METPKEERLALAREKAMEKRSTMANERIWSEVTRSGGYQSCKCELHQGMTGQELKALGAGCTSPQFVCPTLDKYRRLVGV